MIVAVALGLALAIQAFLVKPFRIPSESMVPTLEINQRVLVDRITPKLGNDYERGDIVVFKPPKGADLNTCGAEHPDNQACPEPTPDKSDTNFIKRIVGEPGDRLSVRRGLRLHRREEAGRGLREPLSRLCNLQFGERDHDPARSLLHDGRQPWGIRRQPGMGPRPREVDHRERLRHLLASQEDRHPLARTASASARIPRPPKRARSPKRSGRRLFAFDRQFGHRFVAGADEAGRGCLAGPLFAAAVLFDLERLTLADRRALSRLNDSKQHTEAGREELYPLVMRAAAKAVIVSRCVRGIDARGLHKTNLAALRQALIRVAPPDALCLVDGFRVPDFGVEQRAVVGGDSQSAAIAGASVLAKVARDRFMRRAAERHPGWDFDTNVGYSTPEHRAAIRENGISPLHRLSFASIAYTQLDLEGVFDMVEGDELPPGVEDDAYGVEADAAREALMAAAAEAEPLARHQP